MKTPTILLIEDHPTVRKMICVTLETEGYAVLEAPDGRSAIDLLTKYSVDLVLQDLILPDIDGLELVKRLRSLPGVAETPILAVSASLPRLEQARDLQAGFTDFLFKPVEPVHLLEVVRMHLAARAPAAAASGKPRRILVVNDDPMALKLVAAYLEQSGFQVTVASDGLEALERAREAPPDAVLSDVLMPRMDGFKLCRAIREDPKIGQIPLVLMSAAFTEAADRELAEVAGASALALATPDCREAIRALEKALVEGPLPRPSNPAGLAEGYQARMIRQLERQAALNLGLARRLAVRDAEIAVLAALTRALHRASTVEDVLDELLYRCLGVAEFSKGAVYLAGPDGRLSLWAELGFLDLAEGKLADFFGHAELLRGVMDGGEVLVLPSHGEEQSAILEEVGAGSILILPIVSGEERLGVLMMAGTGQEVSESWVPFATTIGHQVGLAIALARALSLLKEKQEYLERIVETQAEGLVISGLQGQVTFANAAAEKILRLPRASLLNASLRDPPWRATTLEGEPWPADRQPFARAMATGLPVYDAEQGIETTGGDRVLMSVSSAPLRDAAGAVVGAVTSLIDITERKRAEALDRERQELARSNAALERFAYAAAHDLKEPLRTVTGFAQLLAQRYSGRLDARADEFVQRIVSGTRRMRDLIEGLLAYSRAGSPGRRVTPVASGMVFQEALANLQAAVETSGAEVTHDSLPTVGADPLELSQLFQNLVSNALKFRGPESPKVRVSAEKAGDQWIFSVRDNGIGIEPQYAERIFEAFTRLHSAAEYPGSGIGLATCKKIVETHGGRIWVESEPGQGAVFRFSLPDKR